MYLHRVVMENHLGRLLTALEVVHHKNERKKDNRLENLEVLVSQAEHVRRHHKPKTMVPLTCSFCGKAFLREKRLVHKSKPFCSRAHAVSYRGVA